MPPAGTSEQGIDMSTMVCVKSKGMVRQLSTKPLQHARAAKPARQRHSRKDFSSQQLPQPATSLQSAASLPLPPVKRKRSQSRERSEMQQARQRREQRSLERALSALRQALERASKADRHACIRGLTPVLRSALLAHMEAERRGKNAEREAPQPMPCCKRVRSDSSSSDDSTTASTRSSSESSASVTPKPVASTTPVPPAFLPGGCRSRPVEPSCHQACGSCDAPGRAACQAMLPAEEHLSKAMLSQSHSSNKQTQCSGVPEDDGQPVAKSAGPRPSRSCRGGSLLTVRRGGASGGSGGSGGGLCRGAGGGTGGVSYHRFRCQIAGVIIRSKCLRQREEAERVLEKVRCAISERPADKGQPCDLKHEAVTTSTSAEDSLRAAVASVLELESASERSSSCSDDSDPRVPFKTSSQQNKTQLLNFTAVLDARRWTGRIIAAPVCSSLEKALELRRQAAQAEDAGWSAVRDLWRQWLLEAPDNPVKWGRHGGRARMMSSAAAEEYLNSADRLSAAGTARLLEKAVRRDARLKAKKEAGLRRQMREMAKIQQGLALAAARAERHYNLLRKKRCCMRSSDCSRPLLAKALQVVKIPCGRGCETACLASNAKEVEP
eukprot:TRINITY_DN75560_c0_g1_i1.p1 TRINITY_DN75560_c0_g1~~TRINITY_DN75560_c0_g1_i1.p1  ORF type:complete len:610 (+),score=132.32 TRINITY_DN75560_c0_g1_i1:297-2126(+)